MNLHPTSAKCLKTQDRNRKCKALQFYIQKKPVLLEVIYNFTVLYIQNVTSVFRTPRVNNKEYILCLV